MKPAYYNEIDPHAAAWLRQLIADGQIAPGDVDERSICDVRPADLVGYCQCHFFAGVGGWSLALRLAGVADDVPWWTGSCPCQPFSSAGKQAGQADARHLWPAFARLIGECRPERVFGEQVASAIGHGWLDGVSADLEALSYACGATVLGAHSIGAPHRRQRLYWLADATSRGQRTDGSAPGSAGHVAQRQPTGGLAGADTRGCERQRASDGPVRQSGGHDAGGRGEVSSVALGDASQPRLQGHAGDERDEDQPRRYNAGAAGYAAAAGSASHWSDYALLPCRDGKARRAQSGVAPLVDGLPRGMVPSGDPRQPGYADATAEARVMRLRGYGNAIVPELAAQFILAAMESLP